MANINGKSISAVLDEVENGQFTADLTEKLYELIQAAQETRKSAKIAIKLEFKPTGKGMITTIASYDVKKPEHDRPGTSFFIGKDGSLQRKDPNQPDLPLRVVDDYDTETGEVREAPAG
jgi:hypothetical protein